MELNTPYSINAAPCPRSRIWLASLGGLLAVALALGVGFVLGIHPFLAVSEPVPARVLVVEGWLPDYALEAAVAEFRRGAYERLFATGGPQPRGAALGQFETYADSAAAILVKLGMGTNEVAAVPSRVRHRNRTFNSALALREYCRAQGIELTALNLVSQGAHARRSRLCFQRALGADVQVGIIALENREYDPARWWAFSEGLKTALGEPIGFVYAWLSIDYGD